ncbi:MAG TPA: peptidase S8, partial [Balneolaceae bacterium]|nr:peptidase S8 [Balneolaceae bacterium]
PNPFNPTTSIQFGLPTTATVKLSVYNVLGQLVDVLINERRQAGFHTVNFDAVDLSSGVYLFRIEAGSFVDSKKMVLMK